MITNEHIRGVKIKHNLTHRQAVEYLAQEPTDEEAELFIKKYPNKHYDSFEAKRKIKWLRLAHAAIAYRAHYNIRDRM